MKIKKKSMIVCCGKSFGIPRSLTRLTHTFKKKYLKKKHGSRPNLVPVWECACV